MPCEICNEHFGFGGMKYAYRKYFSYIEEYVWYGRCCKSCAKEKSTNGQIKKLVGLGCIPL